MAFRRHMLGLVWLAISLSAGAQVHLLSLDTAVAVQTDGSAIVVERFSPAVPSGTVLWRTRTAVPGRFGIRSARTVHLLDVSDGQDQKLDYTTRTHGDFLELSIRTAMSPEIKISYSVEPAVTFLSDRDEIIWRAGQDWAGAAAESSVTLELPDVVAEQFRAQGSYLTDSGLKLVPVDLTNNSARIECTSVSAGSPCTADVVFVSGLLTESSLWKRAAASLSVNPVFVLPIIIAGLIVGIQIYRIRRVPPTYAPQYEPPDGLTPAEVGVLIDDRLDPRDVVATLVDLAVRGFIRLEECKPDEGVMFQGQDYILRTTRPKDSWAALAAHERTALFHIFYGGEWTKLSSLYQRFYSIVPVIRQDVFAMLRKKGLYRFDPDYFSSTQFPRWAGQAGVVGAYLFILLLATSKNSWIIVGAALAVSVVITLIWLKAFSPKTLLGKRMYAHVRGFQDFMNSVERDHLERVPSEKFQSWLPYAMALGVEHHWTQAFSGIAIPNPEWYEALDDKDSHGDVLGILVQAFARNAYHQLLSRSRAKFLRAPAVAQKQPAIAASRMRS